MKKAERIISLIKKFSMNQYLNRYLHIIKNSIPTLNVDSYSKAIQQISVTQFITLTDTVT